MPAEPAAFIPPSNQGVSDLDDQGVDDHGFDDQGVRDLDSRFSRHRAPRSKCATTTCDLRNSPKQAFKISDPLIYLLIGESDQRPPDQRQTKESRIPLARLIDGRLPAPPARAEERQLEFDAFRPHRT